MLTRSDRDHLESAQAHALLHSAHPTKKVGALLLASNGLSFALGANRLPPGVRAERERPMDLFVEHADRDAIYRAARSGVPTEGSTMYLNWFPCAACARAMAGVGVKRLVSSRRPDFGDSKWGKEFVAASQVLAEAGITTEYLPTPRRGPE